MPGPVSAAALSRRNVLIASGATALGAGLGFALVPGSGDATAAPPPAEPVTGPASGLPAAPTSAAGPAAALPYTAGTTLHSVAAPRGRGGYRRLGEGPGWKRVTRTEPAAAGRGRAARRTSLSCFVQFTDLHLTDVQNPQRYEFLRSAASAGWRPQEALTNAGAVSLVERVNALRYGPATGTPIGFVMTTGDNTDNNSRIELDWFLAVMSGGRFTPDSGDPGHYEGVQASGLKGFWQPDDALRDADKAAGYPRLPGFLAAAVRELNSPGLNVPWYSTIGNHDQLYGGSYAASSFFHDLALGSRKLFWLPPAEAEAVNTFLRQGPDPQGTRFREAWNRYKRTTRTVTADGRRAPVTPREYIAAHLDPAHAGAGPVGHGYTTAELDSGRLHYAFRISDGVLGVSLDTTDRGGDYRGSLGTDQLNWLDRTLTAHAGETVLVFSHHPSWSMTNLVRDPARPGERRHGGDEVLALLGRHPGVAAWINGHSHKNRIVPHGTFWEVSTASHVDYPQLARIIELTDNHDGTLSLLCTLVESAAPYRTDLSDLSQTGLASLYRELAFNAPGSRATLSGEPGDRNVELLLKKR
ncbi:TIGR03767 family metallophosphoesterase [Actinacidiphila glaucinigra]|uniref:TIGR03767 family metallophosphoesterase n=1 Tax=Actinacidiphila glaucinigra TaxID=235986 RepID=UPI002E302E52|nr:TIGR03767 family metallophosphoesterase [Actinacidiphila glaucinigra]